MLPDTDPFAPQLKRFLNTNYETEERYPDSSDRPKPRHPLIFFDRHIASTLQLKSIKHAPWIPKELGRICEDTIRQFTAAGHHFIHSWRNQRNYPIWGRASQNVAEYHFVHIARPCNAYASRLLFNPDDPDWFSFIMSRMDWYTHIDYSFNRFGDTAVLKPKETDTGEGDYEIPPETSQILEDWVIPIINKLSGLPTIFNYEFYMKTKEAEVLLESMGPCQQFKWEIPTVKGASATLASSRPLDSPLIKAFFPSLAVLKHAKPSSRKETTSLNTTTKKRKVVAPLRKTQGRELQYRVNAHHFIQKAWARAVETDATFIVFSCGRLERIGIRHRESQTLYLSDLINPAQWKDPGYCQMHLGLVLAATKDRMAMLDQKEISVPRPFKRKKELSTNPAHYNSMKDKATRRKRRKLNPELEVTSLEMDKKAFDNELAKRDLVLLYLNYGFLQSPAPSSFQRMEPSCVSRPFNNERYIFKRKPTYPPASYISVTANNDYVGDGAVGLIYRITVEIELDSGTKYQRNLILKLAIDLKKERIIQEYQSYKRLAAAGVTYGIIGVHGLFHDMETGAMIMIMDDAGMSLRDRAIEQNLAVKINDSVDTSEEEWYVSSFYTTDAFVEVLKGIHSAHILHDDLRIDNLMINNNGEPFIVDFDCGIYDIDTHPNQYDREVTELMSTIGWTRVIEYEDEDEDAGGGEGDSGEVDVGDGISDGDEIHE
ncbi:hypothetical protein CVT25_006934 [Psilocybe cyanescens]|uniref:Protein kinase domain-containing protein n=1 Tax=Psilocybe cyanescens TaxID=93625 RepID=A0A409X633_PSICY|nr:hypothetical protein CVT25_006934 [Psilocybe cyanescens]